MIRHISLVSALIAATAACVTGFAAVVTDNNLVDTAIPDLANTDNNYVTTPLAVQGRTLYLIQNDIESTVTGYDIADYNIQAIAKTAAPTGTVDLLSYLRIRTYGIPCPKQQRTVRFTTDPGTGTLHFGVAFGRFDNHKAANYRWLASNIRLLTHRYADANLIHPSHGNLVPNASFEDSTANFWYGNTTPAGAIIETNAVHGTHALKIDSAPDIHVGVPVIPGETYDYSFWSASPDIGNGHQIEYGFSLPADGWTKGAGNSSVDRYQGGGNRPWTEYKGFFTPGEGQTTWYLGGMANGGYLLMDSIYVARRAYPGTVVTIR